MARKSTSPFVGIPEGADRQLATLALNRWRQKYRAWERQADKLPNIASMGGHVDFGPYLDYTKAELAAYKDYRTFETSLQARIADIDARVKASAARLEGQQAMERRSAVAKAAAKGVKRGRGRPRKRVELTYGQHVYLLINYNRGRGAAFDDYVATRPSVRELTPYNGWGEMQQ